MLKKGPVFIMDECINLKEEIPRVEVAIEKLPTCKTIFRCRTQDFIKKEIKNSHRLKR